MPGFSFIPGSAYLQNMDRQQLVEALNELGIDRHLYSVGEIPWEDRMVVDNLRDYIWRVFYFDERGGYHNEQTFHSEENACKYLYDYFKERKTAGKL